jgi:hypothetical protein
VSGIYKPLKGTQKHFNILKVQTGRWFIENEQCRFPGLAAVSEFGKVPN